MTDAHVAEREMTVDELAAEAGVPVRRIRFYAGKKLLPPPRLDGRVGLYGPSHLARLRLIGDLQDAGYTLAAIEDFLASLPADAQADDVEVYGTLLTPTQTGPEVCLSHEELAAHVGRDLSARDLEVLEEANLLVREEGGVRLTRSQLDFCLRLLELGAPLDALVEANGIVRDHVGRLAADLQDVFRTRIMTAADRDSDEGRDRLRALAAALRPLTIQAMVTAYQDSLDREVRARAGDDVEA